jgi:plastocyanin
VKPLGPFTRGAPDRPRLAVIIVGFGLVLSACGQPAPSVTPTASPTVSATTFTSVALDPTALPSPVATTKVSIQGFAFHPQVITVPVSATVTWTNMDLEEHTVTASDGMFNSDILENGQRFSFKFAKAGTYDYACQIHPYMHGRVDVTAP